MNALSSQLRYLLLALCMLVTSYVIADDLTPIKIPGIHKITAEELISLVTKLPDLILIDARISGDRKQGYIEGSISIPDVETNCKKLAENIPSTNTPTMFYCNGVNCGRSANAIKIAQKCGYKNIYWFRGGFEEWLEKGFPYLQE